MPPQNIHISAVSASQLEITWDPPPVDSQNGNIQGYKATFVREVEGQLFPPGPASSSVVISFLIMGAKEHPDSMTLAKGLELVINDLEMASATYEE
ncbi:hypothetical protein L345_08250, partial [Ophiophagus hannah]